MLVFDYVIILSDRVLTRVPLINDGIFQSISYCLIFIPKLIPSGNNILILIFQRRFTNQHHTVIKLQLFFKVMSGKDIKETSDWWFVYDSYSQTLLSSLPNKLAQNLLRLITKWNTWKHSCRGKSNKCKSSKLVTPTRYSKGTELSSRKCSTN